MKIKWFVAMTSILFAASVASAKPVYVKSFKGIIKNNKAGQTIAAVPKGTKLEAIGKDGMFTKVSYKGKTGYINSVFLSNTPPVKTAIGFGNLKNPNVIARRRASAEVTAASARGAADENAMISLRGGKLKNGKLDMAPILSMEKYTIADQTLQEFLDEGRVSPR